MEALDRIRVLETNRDEDFKVNVKSKRIVVCQLTKYKCLLKKLLNGQSQFPENDKEKLLQEILTNFQLAVQENVIINGLSWEEAPEEEGEDCECNALDDLLDEKIVQTTWKRSLYPKKILPYVVRCLKAERKLMDLFESGIRPEKLKRDTVQDTIMKHVSVTAARMFEQSSAVMKSLKVLQETAEGLEQVLHTPSSAHTLEVYREALGGAHARAQPVPCHRGPATRHTVKRAVSETQYSMDYVPVCKTTAASADSD